MSDVRTRLHFGNDDSLTVERVQDVEDILNNNAKLRDEINHGRDFKRKWSIPNVVVEKLYLKYNEGVLFPRPMNQEFWEWADKIVMSDADYAYFRTNNTAFRTAYE